MQGVTISIKDELVSKPYVDMTIKLMEKFGVTVERLDGLQKLRIPGCQTYKSPGTVFVEGDASSASYFLAGATMTGGTMRVVGCGSESVQVRTSSSLPHACYEPQNTLEWTSVLHAVRSKLCISPTWILARAWPVKCTVGIA